MPPDSVPPVASVPSLPSPSPPPLLETVRPPQQDHWPSSNPFSLIRSHPSHLWLFSSSPFPLSGLCVPLCALRVPASLARRTTPPPEHNTANTAKPSSS